MKKFFTLVTLLLVVAMMTAACNGQPPSEEQVQQAVEQAQEIAEQNPEAVEAIQEAAQEVVEAVQEAAPAGDIQPVRIAVIMPSATTDMAWSESIYSALTNIQDQYGADTVELAYSEGMFNVTDAAAAIRDYAADGYNLIIAHGTQYGTSLFEIAPDFPETSFAWGTATDTGAEQGLTNVFAYEARAEEGGFVNGVLAAALSESNVVGVVGPVEAGDAKLYIDGFVAGAKAANPDINVNVSYTGSFGDTALAAESANTHIEAGADVLTGSAQQVVGAIGVAKEKGVPWMGTQADQSPLAPEIVVATQFYDWNEVLMDMITSHQAGAYGGKAYALDLANGGLKMLYAEGLPADAVAKAKETEAAIVSGQIDPMEASMGVATEADAGAEAPSIEPVRIAIIMPSTITDLAWSQSIYDSLLAIQAEYGEENVELAYSESMFNVTDAAAAIRDYAADGYNLIIAHGTQYGTSLFEIAPDFPDTSFAWGTATDTGDLDNVFAYEALAQQGGYVNGVLAAAMTESDVIGVVGPVEAGDAKLYIDGFVAGAQAAKPEITVNVAYTGSFGDTALAAESANTHIEAGADILTGSAQQVVGAIGVAKEKGVPWMGTQADQSPLAPEIVVATQFYDWNDVVLDMIVSHQTGEMGGKTYALDLANGGLKMLYADSLPADAVEQAQATEQEIIDGNIKP